MSDQKTFSDVMGIGSSAQTIPPTAKACVNCTHARVDLNAQVMRKVVTCKAVPKMPVAVPNQDPVTGQMMFGIRFFHPTMELHEECDLFELKNGPADGIRG